MRKSLLVASLAVLAASVSIDGQARSGADVTKNANPYTPPRTPWGDPDISGNVTNVFEASTPFERPEGFAGRRLEEIQGEELANYGLVNMLEIARAKDRAAGAISREPAR